MEHSGRQGGASLNKELNFRLWHSGWQGKGSLNKEFDFRSWHCGRQGGEKFTMALCKGKGGEVQIKTYDLDHGIVEGKGGEV